MRPNHASRLSRCREAVVACTADVTPRHRKALRPAPGAAFKWTNTDLATGKPVRSGQVAADQWGLVTLPKVVVTKGKNRLVIQPP